MSSAAPRRHICELVEYVKQEATESGSIRAHELGTLIALIECLEAMDCDDSEDIVDKIYAELYAL